MAEKIIVIEDERDVRATVLDVLQDGGFRAEGYGNGRAGLDAIRGAPPDLVLLDVHLPGMDGIEVCRRLRADPGTCRIPIVMLTGLTEEADLLLGYDVGADDYVTKPWRPKSLLARLRAVLRRVRPVVNPAALSHGPITLHPEGWEARIDGKLVFLTPSEFRILHLLMSHADQPMSRAELLECVGETGDRGPNERNVDAHVRAIRLKLGIHADLISTVWGIGYRWAPGGDSPGGKSCSPAPKPPPDET